MKKRALWFLLIGLLLTNCKTSNDTDSKISEPLIKIEHLIGDYVTEEYFKRADGYDWVAITISKINDRLAQIRIRSRIDKKKATCTFDSVGLLMGKDTLTVEYENKVILFYFKNDTLTIKTKNDDDSSLLNYFCSGGASLAGKYIKLYEPLDKTQLLDFKFTKELSLQNITFFVKSTNEGSLNTLIIEPEGLEITNRNVFHEIDGSVTNAEIEDLNSDGWPEVLIYITSAGSGSYGSVIGYSVNNGKSMSQIYFPDISENDKINNGYMGHDEFSIVETSLVRRFPLYEFGDINAKPTGKIRQIQYKLIDAEASRKFKVEKIYEF